MIRVELQILDETFKTFYIDEPENYSITDIFEGTSKAFNIEQSSILVSKVKKPDFRTHVVPWSFLDEFWDFIRAESRKG